MAGESNTNAFSNYRSSESIRLLHFTTTSLASRLILSLLSSPHLSSCNPPFVCSLLHITTNHDNATRPPCVPSLFNSSSSIIPPNSFPRSQPRLRPQRRRVHPLQIGPQSRPLLRRHRRPFTSRLNPTALLAHHIQRKIPRRRRASAVLGCVELGRYCDVAL